MPEATFYCLGLFLDLFLNLFFCIVNGIRAQSGAPFRVLFDPPGLGFQRPWLGPRAWISLDFNNEDLVYSK